MKQPLTGKTLGERIDQAWRFAGIKNKSEFHRRLLAAAASQPELQKLALSSIGVWIANTKKPGIDYLRLIRSVTGYGLDELVGPEPVVESDPDERLTAEAFIRAIGRAGRVGEVTAEDEADIRESFPRMAALHGGDELVGLLEVELIKARQRRNGLAARDASPGQTRARADHATEMADTLARSRSSKNRKRLDPKKPKR